VKETVSVTPLSSYRREEVERALETLLAPLGGIYAFVRPGLKVLIKPNMLAGKPPERAVTTHPEIVRGVINLVRKAGGTPFVGDSPGVGSPRHVANRCGILDVIEETGAVFAPFSESTPVLPKGKTFHELEIARDVLEADVVINIPKLKTHQMMGLTCAVKNLFGAVVGMRKPSLHLQAGTDKEFFALMLLELAEHISPALTIVDAVTAMEGNGPGSGDPVYVGALLAGRATLAVDAAAIALVGMNPDDVWTQKVAIESGRPCARLEEVNLSSPPLNTLRPPRFRPSKSTDVNFGLPPFLKNLLKNSLTARPVVDKNRCKLCGLCVDHCPPKAMKIADERLLIDYPRCIRCFCCQELCPEGALLTRQGLLLRLSRFIGR